MSYGGVGERRGSMFCAEPAVKALPRLSCQPIQERERQKKKTKQKKNKQTRVCLRRKESVSNSPQTPRFCARMNISDEEKALEEEKRIRR